jgi:hypothetical protein
MEKFKFDVRIDNFVRGVLGKELTIKNYERNEEVALCWLEMDIVV